MVNKKSDRQGRCTYRYSVAVSESECEDVGDGELVDVPPSVRVAVGLVVDMADDAQRVELDDDGDEKRQ